MERLQRRRLSHMVGEYGEPLNSAGYKNIVLYSPRYLASKTYASTWQSIANNAYIGVESYLDGQTVKNDNFSLSKVQAYYQGYYDSWTSASNGAGLAPSRVFAGEHFSVNLYDPTHYWGANGISGTDWQAAIEIRDIAIHNIPFGGFIGYAWDKDAQATGNAATDLAAQISYEKAYASTLVVQSELPAWTGNDGSTSWGDYLNWTGGLPSTTSAPFPLLASTNPNLPKQTTANFLNAIKTNTTITLDGNQSITNLSFGNTFSYTIAPGTGGSLTVAGSGASISVTSGSHTISAGTVIGSNVAANLDRQSHAVGQCNEQRVYAQQIRQRHADHLRIAKQRRQFRDRCQRRHSEFQYRRRVCSGIPLCFVAIRRDDRLQHPATPILAVDEPAATSP